MTDLDVARGITLLELNGVFDALRARLAADDFDRAATEVLALVRAAFVHGELSAGATAAASR